MSERQAVEVYFDSDIATLVFDLPGRSANIFTTEVSEQFVAALESLRGKNLKGLIIKSAKPRVFIAGANIEEIAELTNVERAYALVRRGQQMFEMLANLPFPTVAAINGICLGGGCELTLACTYRIAADSPAVSIGLPEVMLGILPGWGGTQRLPRTIGLASALDLILTGKKLNAAQAKRAGVVDEIVAPEILEAVCRDFLTRRPQIKRKRGPFFMPLLERFQWGRNLIRKKAHASILKTGGDHYPAPFKALDVAVDGLAVSLSEGLELEARACAQLICSRICKNLIHVFALTESVKKIAEPAAGETRMRFDKVGVIGSGIMGSGIAMLFASEGHFVRLCDLSTGAIAKALQGIWEILNKAVKSRRYSKRDAEDRFWRIHPTANPKGEYSGLKTADIIVEAIVEDIQAKHTLFQSLESKVRPDCILASNTSSLSISKIAAGIARPERVVGMHFFNPVHKMPLVEIIAGDLSKPEYVQAVYRLAVKLKKQPVIVKDRPGFLVNRLLGAYLFEAMSLFNEGYEITAIDKACADFGMPMGPFKLMDVVGIDIIEKVQHNLVDGLGDRFPTSNLPERMRAKNWLGQKSGIGFYHYDKQGRATLNEQILALRETRSPSGQIAADKLWERPLFLMLNEACVALEEGVVDGPDNLDLAMITGTGFPPFRGGLIHYARSLDRSSTLDKFRGLEKEVGSRFKAADLLSKFLGTGS